MGRLSGFFIWSATFLLAVISVCRLPDELAQETLRAPARFEEMTAESFENRSAAEPACRLFHTPKGPATDTDDIDVCKFQVPVGGLIVIGSVDVSGARHEVSVESHRSLYEGSPPVLLGNVMTVQTEPRHPDAVTQKSDSILKGSLQGLESTSAITNAPGLSANPATQPEQGGTSDAVASSQRRFLIPHFEEDLVRQDPSLATAIYSTQRITVFLDNELHSPAGTGPSTIEPNEAASTVLKDAQESAARICDTVEHRLLDTISEWIHPVPDLDGDGRLAIVMTDLDRRSIEGETPVLGCVRERDFQEYATADFAGDIIYLDYRLPQGDELAALLAHELTHAAIAAMQLEQNASPDRRPFRIQPWLNEAAAHWVELQFCSEPAGFSDRVQQFHANPSACPIVAPEAHVPLATRRAGSRVSAVSFLQRFINEPQNIHRLLRSPRAFDETVSEISGQSFDAVFRSWSIEQGLLFQKSANSFPPIELSDGLTTTTKLHGTSFIVVQGGTTACDVVIRSRSSAQLQVTLVMPDASNTDRHRLTAVNAD